MTHIYKLGDRVKVDRGMSHDSMVMDGRICTITKVCKDERVYNIDYRKSGVWEEELTKISNVWRGGKR